FSCQERRAMASWLGLGERDPDLLGRGPGRGDHAEDRALALAGVAHDAAVAADRTVERLAVDRGDELGLVVAEPGLVGRRARDGVLDQQAGGQVLALQHARVRGLKAEAGPADRGADGQQWHVALDLV